MSSLGPKTWSMLSGADEHLRWLENERSKRTFNIGDYNVRATPDAIEIKGKTPESWGHEIRMNRARTEVKLSTESRTPLIMFYLVYAAYAIGFLMFFVTTGIDVATQAVIFAVALILMFTPLVLEVALPTVRFLILTAAFYIAVFSLSRTVPLSAAFQAVENAVGKGYVEAFIIFASLFPILLRRMIAQMMIGYRLKLAEGPNKFEVLTSSPGAPALADYLEHGPQKKRFYRLPFFLMTLSRKKMKACWYCGEPTLVECQRCNRPACSEHVGTLRGYRVCLDCFVDRRGKIRRNVR